MLLLRDSWEVWPSEPDTKITPLSDDNPTQGTHCLYLDLIVINTLQQIHTGCSLLNLSSLLNSVDWHVGNCKLVARGSFPPYN